MGIIYAVILTAAAGTGTGGFNCFCPERYMYTRYQRNWPSATANGIPLTDPVAVSFNGDVVLLARQKGTATTRLYYNVRHNDPNATDGNVEYSGWYELDLTVILGDGVDNTPVGLRQLGAGLITLPAAAFEALPASANAFQPADLPFTALSDERYIYVFRPSVNGTVYLDRFVLMQVAAPQEANNQARRSADSKKPTRYQLDRIWESRFRVSGKKDTPADDTDVLGYSNMLGHPFIEPTQELGVLPRLREGRFAVALLPTGAMDQRRWYFFALTTTKIAALSWPQSPDGLFDFLTPSDASLPPSRFEFSPLYDDGTTPLVSEGGFAVRVYAEQDLAKDGTKLRRAMRLMVTMPVSAGSIGLTRALAVFDFGILPSGHLPVPPSPLKSPLIDGTLANKKFTPPVPLPAQFPVPGNVVLLAGNSTIYAYLLGGVQPVAAPFVMDGGDGLVHCYYAGLDTGAPYPFLVAQYDPEVQRPSAKLSWAAGDQHGALELTAQRPGTTLNQLKVTVSDPKSPSAPADLCDMSVDYGSAVSGIGTEAWTGLPRALTALMDVLNGNASGELASRGVQEGSQRYFDYAGVRRQARLPLSAGTEKGWLTLVSTRRDLPLTEVRVSAGSAPAEITVVLVFSQGNNVVTQTWKDAPAAAEGLRSVLRGDAASFPYQPVASDPWVFAPSAAGGSSTMLFYGSPLMSVSQTSLTISAGSTSEKVNVKLVSERVDKSSNTNETWSDLPRDSSLLAKALLAIAKVTAVFPVISASDNTTLPYLPVAVDLQTVSAAVDLRVLSLLFGSLPPGIAATVEAKTVSANVLQGHDQKAPLTATVLVNRLVALVAVAPQMPNNGLPALVDNQASNAAPAAGNGAWVKATPLYALNLTGATAMTVPTNLAFKDGLAPSKTFTLEAWVRPDLSILPPSSKGIARLLSFNGENAAQTASGLVVPSSFVSVYAQPALQFGLLNSASATPSFGYVQPSDWFTPDQAFTLELWFKASVPVSPQGLKGALLQMLDPTNPSPCAMEIALDASLTPVLTVNGGDAPVEIKASATVAANVWTHIGVTGQCIGQCIDTQKGLWQVSLYVNGQNTSIKDKQLTIAWRPAGPNGFFVGGNGGTVDPSAAVSLAELRYWEICRARTDIEDSLYFTLAGTEPGLTGYWRLDDAPGAPDTPWPIKNSARASGKELDGMIQPSAHQAVLSNADGAFLALAAGIGGAPPKKVNAFLRSTHWNHIAVSYRAGTAIRLNGAKRNFVNCGHNSSLNVTDAYTVEAWILVDASTQPVPQTFLGKWGKDPSQQSFWFGLAADGLLDLQTQYEYAIAGKKVLQLVDAKVTGKSLRDGLPHYVAATVSTGTSVDKSVSNSSRTIVVATVTLYVDDQTPQSFTFNIPEQMPANNVFTASVQTTTTDLLVGAAKASPAGVTSDTAPEAQMYLTGMVTGVVLWPRAADATDIAAARAGGIGQRRDGAVAAWWFGEQAGVDAVDSVGGLVARLSADDLWAVYNRLSEMLFYANGRQVLGARNLTADDAPMQKGYPGGPRQFTLGGYQNGNALEDRLLVQFNEVRLWQQVRAPQQIASMSYVRLVGNEDGLSGYWNFDNESLDDRSPSANNGVMWNHAAASFVLSAAPVSNEGPAVRNVYGGQATEFQQRMNGTPAVIEFTEVSREPVSALQPAPKDGQAPKLVGSIERAYYYTSNSVVLTPGFYAGALRLVYFGQIQTDATLLGYIEGAPPVPSENLTRPYYGSATGYFGYYNASSVTFNTTETTTLVFNSSSSYSSTLNHSTTGGLLFKIDFTVNDLLFFTKAVSNELKFGIKESGSFSDQALAVENASASWALAVTDSLALRGNWERPTPLVNPQVGRRFLPDNVGYALVSSLTADVYLTFNAATGASVGRSVVPNPYIPPDNNIITFRINPHYVKNGTLDGKVGLCTDPDYLHAGAVPGSYFKPIEAYRLKKQIAKKALDEEKYYAQMDTYKRALGSTRNLDDQEPYRLVDRTSKQAVARRGIANTYVWTAAGGMHAEQEQFTDQFTTTFTGGYSVQNQFGPLLDFKGANGAGAMIGGFFTLDWLAGFKIDITATKTRTKANTFGLNVAVVGEPALLGWDDASKTYSDKPVPGKVASYRFNTFYLPPDAGNGSILMKAEGLQPAVVDDEWLRSNEPDAVTLRTANTANPAWRVLHRVTYVNRIPPGADNMPSQMLPPPVARIVDLDNNEVLVGLILAALGGNDPTAQNLGAAVMTVVNPPGAAGNYPASQLGVVVPWWDAFLSTTRGAGSHQGNYRLLQGLQLDVLKYVLAGFNDGTLHSKLSRCSIKPMAPIRGSNEGERNHG